jgi:hypothetical protein
VEGNGGFPGFSDFHVGVSYFKDSPQDFKCSHPSELLGINKPPPPRAYAQLFATIILPLPTLL